MEGVPGEDFTGIPIEVVEAIPVPKKIRKESWDISKFLTNTERSS